MHNFNNVIPGDVLRNKGSGEAYIVLEVRQHSLLMVRTVEAMNPPEWDLVQLREGHYPPKEPSDAPS